MTASSPTATPTNTPSLSAPTPTMVISQPTLTPAPNLPAIWVLDGSDEMRAIDPQTGQVLNELPRELGRVASRDGRWRYSQQAQQQAGRWRVDVLVYDMTRSANPKRILLTVSVPDSSTVERAVSLSNVILSRDEHRLYATEAEFSGGEWVTRVRVVDLAAATVIRAFEMLRSPAAREAPLKRALLSSDERRLFVVQTAQRQPRASQAVEADWFTRVAVLDLESDNVESIEVPGEMHAHGFGNNAALSPDSRTLYLLPELLRAANLTGYRFVALDAQTLSVVTIRSVESTNPDEQFTTYPLGMRFTPDGRYLVSYIGGSVSNRTGTFQFLDTQSGLVAQTVSLPRTVQPTTAFNLSYILPSPDNQFVYYADALTKEVFALDLAQRQFVRQAVLRDEKPTLFNPMQRIASWLGDALVSTAYAKMIPWPGAMLSADGERLYMVSMSGEEKGDGVWAVETATLKSSGHWLADKDILGSRLSADERELYAASPDESTLYVLDARTGQTQRALKLNIKPMGFVTPQTY